MFLNSFLVNIPRFEFPFMQTISQKKGKKRKEEKRGEKKRKEEKRKKKEVSVKWWNFFYFWKESGSVCPRLSVNISSFDLER